MSMTSKERMLTALNLGKPDRLPATIHQWQPYHLKYFMNGASDIEAFVEVGLDAAITRFPIQEQKSSNWRISISGDTSAKEAEYQVIIDTPEGQLSQKIGYNEVTSWTIEHLIKRDEDIYLLKKYRPIPVLDKKELEKAYDEIGDKGILRTFVFGMQGGCWQDACELYGTEQLIFASYDKPEWVHEFLSILLEQKLTFIDQSLKGAKADLIETGGGASSNNVISPSLHEEFCLPYDRKIHEALRSIGFPSVYHTCGGMTKILDLILQNGCDASETLSPVGVGGDITDPSVVFNKFTGKIAMIGGMDQFNILTDGNKDAIENEVMRLFEGFGKNGGYIMSASDHFFHAPKENLIAYANAAKKCVY